MRISNNTDHHRLIWQSISTTSRLRHFDEQVDDRKKGQLLLDREFTEV